MGQNGPFGLKNAQSEFQRAMDEIIKPLAYFAIAYIDDVLIFSKAKSLKLFENPLKDLE